jgi:hypothetical protein
MGLVENTFCLKMRVSLFRTFYYGLRRETTQTYLLMSPA